MIADGRGGLALVYRGPAATEGCPESVAALLRASSWQLNVQYVGPDEALPLTRDVLADAVLYAQPGGGSLKKAFKRLRKQAPAIAAYVDDGGAYLGFCLGGYLAGETPGFGLLPGDTDQYIASRGASIRHDGDAIVSVDWGGHRRDLYFQDGPFFVLEGDRGPAEVLARYGNGLPAAVVAPHGRGAVGVVGPHPEATRDWFEDEGLSVPHPLAIDLGLDLVDRVLRVRERGRLPISRGT